MLVTDEKGKVIINSDNFTDINKSPYHLTVIPKGKLGELSKIKEELAELEDAEAQGLEIMIGIELSDLYGAVEFYAEKHNLTMEDLKKFSDLNKRVKSGGKGN